MRDDVARRLDIALRAATAGGDATLPWFRGRGFAVDRKADGTVVTEADRAAERVIRDLIRDAFPQDALLGEEHGESAGTSGWRWIIDPIDGTTSFVQGVSLYGTLVAAEDEGGVQVGVIHMPALGETVWAGTGGGAWHRPAHAAASDAPVPARTSRRGDLASAVFCTTSWDYFTQAGAPQVFARLAAAAGTSRGWSDCYGYLLLATGRVDAVVEPVLAPWDVACMYPIVREAGGRISDWQGGETGIAASAIATNGELHEAVLRAVRG